MPTNDSARIEIQRADPRQRRVVAVVLVVATLAAAALVIAAHRWLSVRAEQLTADQMIAQMRLWLAVVTAMVGMCLLLLGGHAARTARCIGEQGRWPLAGARPLRDTPVRHGPAALRFGRWLQAAAFALVLLALGAGLVSWRLFVMVR